MERIDALEGHPSGRQQELTGNALSTRVDEQLQAVVEEAAAGLRTPIALVSLVLERTQFFRAAVGLPFDLATAQGTDRDVSFCQFVVRDGNRFEVANASEDARIPTDLVDRYGIRAYMGEPVRIAGVVVGSLCGIDTVPRAFTDEERSILANLARRASLRLEALAREKIAPPSQLVSRAAEPMLGELSNIVSPLLSNAAAARVALADLAPLVRLSGQLPPEAVALLPAYGSLKRAGTAFEDLQKIVDEVVESTSRLRPLLRAVEHFLRASSEAVYVHDVVTTAGQLALHLTKLIGGVRWAPVVPNLCLVTSRIVAVSAVSAALSLLASALPPGTTTGLDGTAEAIDGTVVIALGSPELGSKRLARCRTDLEALLSGCEEVKVFTWAEGLELRFIRSDAY